MKGLDPHASPLREVRCPPGGLFSPWGGSAVNGRPHARMVVALLPRPSGERAGVRGGSGVAPVCGAAPTPTLPQWGREPTPASARFARPPGERGRQRLQRGFSLLEILVAFAIAALALGMLYRVSGNNARQVGGLDQHERAMLLAQSLLATYAVVPARGLNDSGEGAGYSWQVQSRPYPTPVNSASPQAARLYEVAVHVQWLDGNAERSFDLSSLRPERLPQPGETVR